MTLLNLAPANYNYNSSLFSSNVGKVDNIGENGTVCNTIAAEGKYVNSPGKMIGGDGYGFTDKFPGKIIGPDAGYLGIDKYSAGANTFARSGNVTAHWKNLTGGKRRRHYRQVGCKKRGGRTHRRMRSTHKRRRTHRHKHTKRMRSTRTRTRKHRGGNGQPYSNIPISFGQSFDSKLSAQDSALASPVPMTPYSRCASVPR